MQAIAALETLRAENERQAERIRRLEHLGQELRRLVFGKGGNALRFAYCWTHCRRKLREVFDRDGSQIAAEGLRRIAELYAVKADIRGRAPPNGAASPRSSKPRR